MALVNCRRNIRGAKTRLINLTNAITGKNYEIDNMLNGQVRFVAVRAKFNEATADKERLKRALDLLGEWQNRWETVLEDAEGDIANAENEFEQFLNAENVQVAEDGARDQLDRLEGVIIDLSRRSASASSRASTKFSQASKN